MAFRTRTGRTAAIGNGAISIACALWLLSVPLLLVALAAAGFIGAWFIVAEWRPEIDAVLPSALGAAIYALGLLFVIRVFVVMCGVGLFIGPRNTWREQVSGVAQARTARRIVFSLATALALIATIQIPFGDLRAWTILTLTVLLAVTDALVIRGLYRIRSASRRAAYYEGLTEEQKRIADRPWPTTRRPTFPAPDARISRADAERYARRANDIALIHDWLGGGLILVFSAFVGATIPAMWESRELMAQVPMFIVLGVVALGFWLQRRARSYRGMAQTFEAQYRRRLVGPVAARGRRTRNRRARHRSSSRLARRSNAR